MDALLSFRVVKAAWMSIGVMSSFSQHRMQAKRHPWLSPIVRSLFDATKNGQSDFGDRNIYKSDNKTGCTIFESSSAPKIPLSFDLFRHTLGTGRIRWIAISHWTVVFQNGERERESEWEEGEEENEASRAFRD
ncbi:MAG: hypothetical protein Q9215_002688 [Flavoplaca cf. flavocitrina]